VDTSEPLSVRDSTAPTTDDLGGSSVDYAREVVELDREEAMRLLASVDYGRVVFTQRALPAIRPVNHLVDGDRVIVRSRLSSTVSTVVGSGTNFGVVVAYQADDLDPHRRLGWSVVVTGLASTVTDPEQRARYEQLLQPWVSLAMDTVIAIDAGIVTGIRIVDGHPARE
jgi:hypothetical protein